MRKCPLELAGQVDSVASTILKAPFANSGTFTAKARLSVRPTDLCDRYLGPSIRTLRSHFAQNRHSSFSHTRRGPWFQTQFRLQSCRPGNVLMIPPQELAPPPQIQTSRHQRSSQTHTALLCCVLTQRLTAANRVSTFPLLPGDRPACTESLVLFWGTQFRKILFFHGLFPKEHNF